MRHTLVTLLGKGRNDPVTGYRKATYRFPNGTTEETAFFGLAMSRYLEPDVTVILGTCGSQWGVLVEHLAKGDEAEESRRRLIEAEAEASVEQSLLDDLAPLMSRTTGCEVVPRLIPFGQDPQEQYRILTAISETVSPGTVSFDLTHGFRHLGMIGFLSTFLLEHVRDLEVRGLWYGALDMSRDGVTPVLRLDGLVRVRRWLNALGRFDATGDYGVFEGLLIEDGVAADKAACLRKAAFLERTSSVWDAARQLQTFLPVLDTPLPGAAGMFQDRLAKRLEWAGQANVVERQRRLAYQYLSRGDYLRAAIFGLEACVTRACEARGIDLAGAPLDDRTTAVEEFEMSLRDEPSRILNAYWLLKNVRDALAHASPPESPGERPSKWRKEQHRRLLRALREPDQLSRELEAAFRRLLN